LLCDSLCRHNLHWCGAAIEYSHISDRLYFGFEARDGFNLALPEKALLDCTYYRNAAPFEDELELEGVDTGRLQTMAQSFTVKVREVDTLPCPLKRRISFVMMKMLFLASQPLPNCRYPSSRVEAAPCGHPAIYPWTYFHQDFFLHSFLRFSIDNQKFKG
jgi:hypothetical protein